MATKTILLLGNKDRTNVYRWASGPSPSMPSSKVVSDSCDLMDCSPPGFFIHGISQARILEQVAISFSSGLPKRMPLSSHTLQADSLPLARPGKPLFSHLCCSLSRVQLFVTPWIAARQSSLSITSPSPYSNSCPLSQ